MKNFTYGLIFMMNLIYFGTNAQESCTPHDMPTNDFDSKAHITKGGQWVAHDFFLTANTINFSLEQVTANLWSQGGIASIDIIIYQDDNNHPGSILGDTISDIIPTSQEILITKDDGQGNMWDVHDVVLDLATAIEITGTGNSPVKYWLQLIATPDSAGTNVGWDLNFEDMIGSTVNFANPNNPTWNTQNGLDGVFTLNGECTYIEGCQIPVTLTVTDVTTSTATVNWVGSDDAVEYVLEYGPEDFAFGEGTEVTLPAGTTSFTLEDLELLVTYDVYIKSVCENGESIYTVPLKVITEDIYCFNDVANIIEPITYVEFAGIENTVDNTINGTDGHLYFVDQVAVVDLGESYIITVQGNTNGYTNGFTAFIDWNQDGEFNNTDERYDIGTISSSDGQDGADVSATIDVPENALQGITRLRVMKEDFSTSQYVEEGCSYIGWGQIQDYTVNVTNSTGISEFDKFEFTYGPNPSNQHLNLNSTTSIDAVAVYNLMGQKVLQTEVKSTTTTLNISALSSGTYFMEVSIEGEQKTFKVVKN